MTLIQRFHSITNLIIDTELAFGRQKGEVSLLAVSKKQSLSKIKSLYQLGQQHFGENYLQDALEKISKLNDLDIIWHFIGQIQSRKAKAISQHFHWVHSVDRIEIMQKLNQHRPQALGPLNICIQINLNEEASKGGINADELDNFLQASIDLANIKVRGLMVIPKAFTDFDSQRHNFNQVKQMFETFKVAYQLDTLSMGMSQDFKAAIAEGATIIRIGTALFGPREN